MSGAIPARPRNFAIYDLGDRIVAPLRLVTAADATITWGTQDPSKVFALGRVARCSNARNLKVLVEFRYRAAQRLVAKCDLHPTVLRRISPDTWDNRDVQFCNTKGDVVVPTAVPPAMPRCWDLAAAPLATPTEIAAAKRWLVGPPLPWDLPHNCLLLAHILKCLKPYAGQNPSRELAFKGVLSMDPPAVWHALLVDAQVHVHQAACV
jgi:hypothetical protein